MFQAIERFFRPREKKEVLGAEKTLYVPQFDVLVFSGYAGTGKTSAADAINEILVGTQFIKVGQNMRRENLDFFDVAPEDDIKADEEQDELMRSTINSFPLILESRLGPVLGADIAARMGEASPRIVRVLFTADKHVRDMRVWKRDSQNDPDLTLEQSIAKTEERDAKFVERMQNLYPELLRGQNPFDSGITAIDGTPVYDLIIDTTFVSQERAPEVFIKSLMERGLVSKLQRSTFGEGKAGDVAFEKIRRGTSCDYDGCQRLSTITVDSVTPNTIYSFGVCSENHGTLLESDIVSEITEAVERGTFQSMPEMEFGRNGFAKAA